MKHFSNIVIYRETSWTISKTSWTTSKTYETLKALWNIMKHSPFDVETSALGAEFLAIAVFV